MRQEEKDFWKATRLFGERGMLHLDKTDCLVGDLMGTFQKKEEQHPELCRMLDLDRVRSELRYVRLQIREIKKIWDHLRWSLYSLEHGKISDAFRERSESGARAFHLVADTGPAFPNEAPGAGLVFAQDVVEADPAFLRDDAGSDPAFARAVAEADSAYMFPLP